MSRRACSKASVWLLSLALWAAPDLAADAIAGPPARGIKGSGLEESTLKDAVRALDAGLTWLRAQQNQAGHWSQPQYPALTALPVLAILSDPRRSSGQDLPEPARRGLAFLAACGREDGGIYVSVEGMPPLPHYNTALAMTALVLSGDPAYRELVHRARAYLAGGQHLGEGLYYGGYGYDAEQKRNYADLSGTYMVLEAMAIAERAEATDQPGVAPPARLNWKAALDFVSRVQNLPETNSLPWAQAVSADDRGGFVYHPDESKAGDETSNDGSRRLHSYGSMSYAGLLSFLYADVDRDDIRVQAAVDWLRRHYTVEENPRMGSQGLYYNFHTMAKALSLWDENAFTLADGSTAWWRRDLAARITELQKIDPATGAGYWVNENGRWWENDPVLATSYALIALSLTIRPAMGG